VSRTLLHNFIFPSEHSLPKLHRQDNQSHYNIHNQQDLFIIHHSDPLAQRPTTPVKKQKVSRRDTEKATISTSGSIDHETQPSRQDTTGHNIEPPLPLSSEVRAPAQNTTELNRPTIKLRLPPKKTTAPETETSIDITPLALQDRPDATPEAPLQPTRQRRVHPAYPNLTPEVPVDEEGIHKFTPLFNMYDLNGECTIDFDLCE
jgi:hypothetical protein